MNKLLIPPSKAILWSFVLLLLSDALDRAQSIEYFGFLPNSTYLLGALKYGSLVFLSIILVQVRHLRREMPVVAFYFISLWCFWCMVTIARGLFTARDYWDWKFLLTDNLLRYSVHYSFLIGLFFMYIKPMISFIAKWVFGFSFLLLFLSSGSFDYYYSYIVMPITILVIFLPFVGNRRKILFVAVAACSLLFALDFRANALRLAFAFILLFIYYSKLLSTARNLAIFRPFHFIMFTVPLVMFYMGATGEFNVFKDTLRADITISKTGYEENLAADTRTFLYVETLRTLLNNNSLTFGEGAAGSYTSYAFEYLIDDRRYATEVGFLNVLLHSGIVGVFLYFLILYLASYYAIFKSNNSLTKMLGFFLAFRWSIFFVEDMTAYNMSMYFLWVTVGLCMSSRFRKMSDYDMAVFFGASRKTSTWPPLVQLQRRLL